MLKDNLAILKTIKDGQKRPDGIFGSFMTRPISHIFAFIALKLRLTPNGVSIASFLFSILAIFPIAIDFFPAKNRIIAVTLWWFGAILDSSDGDLARYLKTGNPFGAWLDSFLDRIKEIAIFSTLGWLAYKNNGDIYLLLTIMAISANLLSGYISDTKKMFLSGVRKPEIAFSKKYSFGMVDTRDFFVILAIILAQPEAIIWLYATVFNIAVLFQFAVFYKKFGIKRQ